MLVACSSAPPPPRDVSVPVTVAKVVRKSMPELVTAVGTVEAINSVALKSLVDGQLLESHVKDGDDVKAGQLLFKIDPRPAQAALAQAQAGYVRGSSNQFACSDIVLPNVKSRRPVRRRAHHARICLGASGASTSTENTPVKRFGCAATASATYELSWP